MDTKVKTLEETMKDDLVASLKRLSELQQQRVSAEQVLRSVNREMQGLEAVVGYIRSTLKNGSVR